MGCNVRLSEGYKDLIRLLGNDEIDAALAIHRDGCIEIEFAQRDGALLPVDYYVQGGWINRIAVRLNLAALGENENRLGDTLRRPGVLCTGHIDHGRAISAARDYCMPLVDVLHVRLQGQASETQQTAQPGYSTRASLSSDDIALAVDGNIIGKTLYPEACGKAVAGIDHDPDRSRVGPEVVLDAGLRFAHINGENNQPLAGIHAFDVIENGLIGAALWALRRPKLQQDHSSAERCVVEGFAIQSLGSKLWGRSLSVSSD